ncbi:sensor histidine kinase [Dyadobacter sp. 32]|uniref:sensor histidine kinase n=1 Tax=Dyadobacter sp. 32 TaxID=538966 RepID=UPI0011EF168F
MEQFANDPSDENLAQHGVDPDVDMLHHTIEVYQQKIVELGRLADIGQLSAGILHEIKNPVSFVNNFSRLSLGLIAELRSLSEKDPGQLTEDDYADQKDILDSLAMNVQKINDNGKRIERIVQGMLSQTRTDSPVLEPTDLNQLLEEFSKLAYQGVRAEDKEFNVTLKYLLDTEVKEVNLSRGELGRVILNLVNNACYAVNEKLKMAITGYDPVITISTKRLGSQVEIRVKDNGIGIPEDIVSKLFLPFFTTKPHGKGTGLGLSLTYNTIAETHKGTIEVHSTPGEQTEFIIVIPA